MKKYTVRISQNINGKEQVIKEFEFEQRKLAIDAFRSLKETCKAMSEQHYTVIRLLINDNFEVCKFSWEKGRNLAHFVNNCWVNPFEVA